MPSMPWVAARLDRVACRWPPALLAREPQQVAGCLCNAVFQIASQRGTRPDAWIDADAASRAALPIASANCSRPARSPPGRREWCSFARRRWPPRASCARRWRRWRWGCRNRRPPAKCGSCSSRLRDQHLAHRRSRRRAAARAGDCVRRHGRGVFRLRRPVLPAADGQSATVTGCSSATANRNGNCSPMPMAPGSAASATHPPKPAKSARQRTRAIDRQGTIRWGKQSLAAAAPGRAQQLRRERPDAGGDDSDVASRVSVQQHGIACVSAAVATSPLETLRDQWLRGLAGGAGTLEPVRPAARADVVLHRQTRRSREQLSGSFAMIRLVDHSIVVSLRQVQEAGLERFAGKSSLTRSAITSIARPT